MDDDKTYIDVGFNKLLTKQSPPDEMTEDTTSLRIEYKSIPVLEGNTDSPDGRLQIDWNGDNIIWGDGAIDRIKIGYHEDVLDYRITMTEADLLFNTSGGLAFGEIHVHDASAAQSIATGTTYTKLTAFTDSGLSNNCSPDGANDKITITQPGKYLVNCSINAFSGTANVTFKYGLFLDGTEQDHIHAHRKYGTANDYGSSSLTGIIDVTAANQDVDVRARHDNGSNINLTVSYMNLNVVQIGG